MKRLELHELHEALGARFAEVNGAEVALDYGDSLAEYDALQQAALVCDLSFRSRLCVTGTDRVRFLHGQVSNDVKELKTGEGCYAALVTAKGKMESDLNIYALENELLLDFEPGFAPAVASRLEKFIIADDVQIVDVSDAYTLLNVQGPKAGSVVGDLGLAMDIPSVPLTFFSLNDATLGEVYLMNNARSLKPGFDLFVPSAAVAAIFDKLVAAAKAHGGRAGGWTALEIARMEAGIPRFGQEMDATNLAPEAGIEQRAISYTKGCYIGQEVISRIRAFGQVAKSLRGLRLADASGPLPQKGDKILREGKEVGYIASAIHSPALQTNIALGYVRREHNDIGTEVAIQAAQTTLPARIVPLPFKE